MSRPRTAFGLNHLIPEGSPAAWGARLIVTQDGAVDFLADRQGADGPKKSELLDLLNTRAPVSWLKKQIAQLLTSGAMVVTVQETFVIYADAELTIEADTNGSHGYCYVQAWLTPEE